MMNPGLTQDHPSIRYYESDYPAPWDTRYAENFDATTEYQGLAADVPRYLEIASTAGGPILELCCGSGRVSIPLAREGHPVTGVDISSGMLEKFRQHLVHEPVAVRERITLVEQDVTRLDLQKKDFTLAIVAFNSLLCIPDFNDQRKALIAAACHLAPKGQIVIDIVNPVQLPAEGSPVPKPFFTRKDVNTGNTYTRFAMMGPFDAQQRQELYGWYDELDASGAVRRRHYSLWWRPIYRYEIELMLENAGLSLVEVEGGHRKEPYTAQSPRMFLRAVRRS